MLQRLLLITITLCSLSASAQWQQTGSKVRYVNGLGIPTKDTAAGVAADSSQILIRPADSSLYVKYKRTWIKVGGGTVSGTINRVPKFTGTTTLGNSSIVDSASAVAMTINPSGNVIVSGSLGVNNQQNLYFPESSTASYANIFRQSSTAALVLANGYKYSSTAGGFASSFVTTARTAIQVGGGTISFFTDPSSTVAIGTDITATERIRLTNAGRLLIGSTLPTDNGVDQLQVNGSVNVSAKATAQTLSVTSNATVGGTLNVTGISTFSSRLNAVSGGIRLGAAGVSESLSVYLGGSTDAYPLVNNAYVISGVGWKYLNNGPASIIGYVSGELFYYNCPTNSSGADATLSTITQRMMITANGNMGIGSYTAPAAKLVVDGSALINTNTDNTVDKLQVNGSISGIGFKQAYVTKTGAYTATNDDYVIDCTSGTFTVTLPASSGRTGRILIIKNSGAGTITVDGNASETIDGATTYSLSVQYATVQIMSDGTNWKIIAKF